MTPKSSKRRKVNLSNTIVHPSTTAGNTLDEREEHLYIHHIDVGQGESTLILLYAKNAKGEFEVMTSVLIDGGNLARGKNTVIPYIRELGLDKIDVVICSHVDSDHSLGLGPVLGALNVGQVYHGAFRTLFIDQKVYSLKNAVKNQCESFHKAPASSQATDDRKENDVSAMAIETSSQATGDRKENNVSASAIGTPSSIRAAAATGEDRKSGRKRKRTERYRNDPPTLWSGTSTSFQCTLATRNLRIPIGSQCELVCIGAGDEDQRDNRMSLAFMLEFHQFRYFTAGDLESDQEVIKAKRLCAFKCGHHGSSSSTSGGLLGRRPRVAFISCGKSAYKHPDPELVAKLQSTLSIETIYLTNDPYDRMGLRAGSAVVAPPFAATASLSMGSAAAAAAIDSKTPPKARAEHGPHLKAVVAGIPKTNIGSLVLYINTQQAREETHWFHVGFIHLSGWLWNAHRCDHAAIATTTASQVPEMSGPWDGGARVTSLARLGAAAEQSDDDARETPEYLEEMAARASKRRRPDLASLRSIRDAGKVSVASASHSASQVDSVVPVPVVVEARRTKKKRKGK